MEEEIPIKNPFHISISPLIKGEIKRNNNIDNKGLLNDHVIYEILKDKDNHIIKMELYLVNLNIYTQTWNKKSILYGRDEGGCYKQAETDEVKAMINMLQVEYS